ncbi:protein NONRESPONDING TO OXYLIPINS 2, mitochondrial-like [Vicia villosa]|uniref:protein NONRESPONDING TO OXYLIPINS 2, mitochondrial-like n=1 Tax=Vicia villosa TaxID=3911 RepID=UPI00273A8837|nr:protein NONRESPONDING TO OXYLIPINS 2, mitochondrial-like [Vicia villosa]
MATSSSKAFGRLSSRLHSLVNNNNFTTKPSPLSHLKPKLQSATLPRVPLTSRLPVELGSLESMLPLYSAVASARLVSSLSIESLGWGLVPQGISMPL